MTTPLLHENDTTVKEEAGELVFKHHQSLPQRFFDSLSAFRSHTASRKSGEYKRVASVPTAVWELWIRQGRDPANATAHQIVKWLREENLHAFLATDSAV